MERVIIIAKGKVQKVRYRSKVKEIADELGIVGGAENLEDGSVRIVAEGKKEKLADFITRIKIKNYLIDVQDVSVSFEEASGGFDVFRKVISGTMYEVAERLDEAAGLLERLTGAVTSGNEKIIGTIEQGNEKIIGTIEQGNDKIIGTIEQGNEKIIGTIEQGNDKIIGTIEQGNDKIIGTIEQGNDKIIGTIEQGNEKITSTIEQGNEKLAGKQDQTIEILKSVKEDTDVMREDIGEIKDALSIITGIREETKELSEKYDALGRDVEEIKRMLKK